MVTSERLRELLYYCPYSGRFFWLAERWRAEAGGCAGGESGGYVRIGIDGQRYQAHRLAWLYIHGEWPDVIDHINKNKADNRLANIRACSIGQNNMNTPVQKNNKSGLKGVYFSKSKGKYTGQVMVSGVKYSIGYFACPEEAYHHVTALRQRLHGSFSSSR